MVTYFMGKVRRGNYIFVSWKGDHSPKHVHVYKDGRFVLKWDLENWTAMAGRPTKRLLKLIRELLDEGAI